MPLAPILVWFIRKLRLPNAIITCAIGIKTMMSPNVISRLTVGHWFADAVGRKCWRSPFILQLTAPKLFAPVPVLASLAIPCLMSLGRRGGGRAEPEPRLARHAAGCGKDHSVLFKRYARISTCRRGEARGELAKVLDTPGKFGAFSVLHSIERRRFVFKARAPISTPTTVWFRLGAFLYDHLYRFICSYQRGAAWSSGATRTFPIVGSIAYAPELSQHPCSRQCLNEIVAPKAAMRTCPWLL